MKIGRWTAGILVLVMVGMGAFTGCAKAPTAEVEGAKEAVARADSAEAGTYAPEDMQTAKNALDDAMNKMNAKDYKGALAAATTATTAAQTAMTNADAKKNEVRLAAESMKTEIPNVMAQAHQAVMDAKKSRAAKSMGPAIASADSTLTALDSLMNEATNDFDAGHFMSAQAKFTQIKSQAESVVTNLTAGMPGQK